MTNNQPRPALAGVIAEKFIAADPKAAAQALASLATHEVLLLVGGLKAQSLIAVLGPMEAPKAAAVLRRLPLKQAGYVLTHLPVAQAAKLWKEFSAPYQARLKGELAEPFVALLQEAGTFGAGSVGNGMQTDFVAVRTETKISELVARLKNLPRKKLPLLCFVTGREGELKGTLRTAELAFFNPQSVCGSVMNTTPHTLAPQQTAAQAQAVFEQAQADVLPVVDDKNRLLGFLDKMTVLSGQSAKTAWWHKLTK